jgi:hypothetical protein
MSSDGIRKQTLGWDINASGGMAPKASEVVVIEAPPQISAAIPIDSGAIIVDTPPPPPPEPRGRRSTLETFNDEMAVLERPLEDEVEYIDEKPPRRWGHVAAFVATVTLVGGGGAYLLSQHRAAAAAARGEPVQPAMATARAPASPPVAALEPGRAPAAAAPAAPAAAPTPAEEDDTAENAPSDEAAADHHAPSRTAWTKVHSKPTAHAKHARSGGGKAASRHTTSAKHHVAKRTVARR